MPGEERVYSLTQMESAAFYGLQLGFLAASKMAQKRWHVVDGVRHVYPRPEGCEACQVVVQETLNAISGGVADEGRMAAAVEAARAASATRDEEVLTPSQRIEMLLVSGVPLTRYEIANALNLSDSTVRVALKRVAFGVQGGGQQCKLWSLQPLSHEEAMSRRLCIETEATETAGETAGGEDAELAALEAEMDGYVPGWREVESEDVDGE